MKDERVPNDEQIEERASKKLQVDEVEDADLSDAQVAKRAAQQILEDSEARTREAVDLDPTDRDSIIRRSSSEGAREP